MVMVMSNWLGRTLTNANLTKLLFQHGAQLPLKALEPSDLSRYHEHSGKPRRAAARSTETPGQRQGRAAWDIPFFSSELTGISMAAEERLVDCEHCVCLRWFEVALTRVVSRSISPPPPPSLLSQLLTTPCWADRGTPWIKFLRLLLENGHGGLKGPWYGVRPAVRPPPPMISSRLAIVAARRGARQIANRLNFCTVHATSERCR